MRWVFALGAVLSLTTALADERKFDQWETETKEVSRLSDLQAQCFDLGARMVEVRGSAREQAVAMLETDPFVPLTTEQVRALVPDRVLIPWQLAEAEAKDHDKKASENEANLANAERLGTALSPDASYYAMAATKERYLAAYNRWAGKQLKPYLVRGVLLNEFTGSFGARECGSTVWVGHSSLGRNWPTPQRRALIVFLLSEPRHLIVTTSMAS